MRVIGWSCAVCVSLMAAWAHAETLDEAGTWVPEGDAQMGFTAQDLVESRVFGLNSSDAPQLVLRETSEALEGDSVLEIGGSNSGAWRERVCATSRSLGSPCCGSPPTIKAYSLRCAGLRATSPSPPPRS